MGCRAGITTRPEERKREWKRRYPTLRNWQQQRFTSRAAAQSWENQQWGCERHGGGSEPDYIGAVWYGYRFDF